MGTAHGRAAAVAGVIAVAVPALPIPAKPTADSPRFVGSPAKPRPIFGPRIPSHPFMAPNGRSNVHVDAYQSDVNTAAGPLGTRMRRVSSLFGAECLSVTFD